MANVQAAIEHIFPLVYEFRKKRSPDDPKQIKANEAAALKRKNPFGHVANDPTEDTMYVSDVEELFVEEDDMDDDL